MPYKSQDFQTMCADFIGQRHVPNSILDAAKNYHPRLHRLLIKADQKVFDTDVQMLADFLRKNRGNYSLASPAGSSNYAVQQQLHNVIRKMNQDRLDKKAERPAYRLARLKQQMSHLQELGASADPATRDKINKTLRRFSIHHLKTQPGRRAAAADFVAEVGGAQKEIALLTKKTMIRKARTLGERRERADELVHDIVDRRAADSDRHQTNPGMDPVTGRPLLAG